MLVCCARTLSVVGAALIIVAVAPVVSTAQFPIGRPLGLPPDTMPRRPATAAPPESDVPVQQPTFRTTVEFVEVAVVPTDKNGQFVGDLTREDFELFEQRRRQRIVAFTKVDLPTAMAPASDDVVPTTGAGPAPTERVDSNALSDDARVYVLLLDDLHVASERTLRVRENARAFIERYTSAGDLVSVVLVSGRTNALGFSRDRQRLLASVERFNGQKLRSATYERYVDQRLGGGTALWDDRDPNDGERAYRARASMATLADVTRVLASTGGRRKALLYFSEGIDYNVADVMGRVQRYASEVTHTMADALSAATRANVTVYAIDPRGLASGEEDAIERPIYAERPVVDLSEPGRMGEESQAIQSLRGLTEPTGGFAATDVNGIDAAFARIVRENSSYYVMGFEPSASAKGGAFREIDVRVKRKGVTLVTRKGYLVPRRDDAAPEAPADAAPELLPELAHLLRSVLPVPGLALRLQAIPFRSESSSTRVHVVVEVDGSQLAFEAKGPHFTERVDLAVLTVDATGRAGNGTQAALHLTVKEDEVGRVRMTGLRWLSTLDLQPGHYQLRVAGTAANSAQRGLAIAEVDVPDFDRSNVALSGVALTSLPAPLATTSGERWPYDQLSGPPTATRRFVAGDRVSAFAQLYQRGPALERGALHVTATVVATSSGEEVPVPVSREAETSDADLSTEHLTLAFDTTSLPAAQYVLSIQGRTRDGRTVAQRVVPFEVVPRAATFQ